MGLFLLKGDAHPQDVIAIAYGLEEGLRKFYADASQTTTDSEVAALLTQLAAIEETHKQRLFELNLKFDPRPADTAAWEADIGSKLMEGGLDIALGEHPSLGLLETPHHSSVCDRIHNDIKST